ncbi:NAD(P)-dependent oxidoreductase [Promicromonospora sp. MEB111]|uniref:NAD(P)-dependent oxidoreductase n=1 Tax=Promicromonospora sp. MEB111 TaxID=3040301 RepID=UPI00254E49D3|nr:NAD(P)-dependent oxidoreductase [Promicromonospora sp. MEB111]
MTSRSVVPDLADTLRRRPTVRLGDDVDPGWRDALTAWARSHGLEVTDGDATLAITTDPGQVVNAAWVHSPFAGVEHLAPALPDDVLLTRTTGTMPGRIAEYVLTWVLAERWQVARYLAQSTTATWDASKPPASPDRRTAVVVGTGAMGAAIAGTLATLGYRVVGLSRTGRPARAFDAVLPLAQAFDATSPEPTTSRAPSPTEQVFDTAQADVLVLALPHTPQTDGLITPGLLRAFERVHLVNIGRGSAVRTATLLDALDSGRVRHATLDVVEREPLEASSPLWRRPDVTITPHVSGLTLPSDVVAGLDAALTAIRAGARPESAVARDRGY